MSVDANVGKKTVHFTVSCVRPTAGMSIELISGRFVPTFRVLDEHPRLKRKRESVEMLDRVYPVIDVEAMIEDIEQEYQWYAKQRKWWEVDRLY